VQVAITGACGLLGRSCVGLLLESGHRVVALGRDLERLRARLGPAAAILATDYAAGSLAGALHGCEALVHLAARRIAPAQEGMAAYLEPNVALTERVLAAAAAAGLATVCLASSIAVYSAANTLPFREDQAPIPGGFYGLSKLAAEHLGRLYGEAGSLRVVSLRLASLVGAGDETASDRMVSVFVDRARRREPLVVWGEGGGGRDLLYVRDAARAVARALSAPGVTGPINIGSGRPHSFREVAETINQVFGNAGNLRFDRTREEDRRVSYMDCRLAASQLGWGPQWTLGSAFEDLRRAAPVLGWCRAPESTPEGGPT